VLIDLVLRISSTSLLRNGEQVLYDVDHRLGHWFIVTNEHGAGNFKLMTSPVHKGGSPEHWVPLVQAEPKTIADDGESDALPFSNGQDVTPGALMIEEIECFKDFVAISGRMGGYTKVFLIGGEVVAPLRAIVSVLLSRFLN